MAALGLENSNEAAGSAIRASYGILVSDETVQALARENDPSQVAGTDAFKNRGFGAIVQAARESQEVYETITADPDNLDKFLEVLAHMIVAAKDDQDSK
jgi:type I restriction enzyme R subunit